MQQEQHEAKRRALLELKEIQRFLAEWDPLGVIEDLVSAGRPPSEYDSYAPGVHTLLRGGAGVEELTEHLARIEREEMERRPSLEEDKAIAQRIVEWWRSRSLPTA